MTRRLYGEEEWSLVVKLQTDRAEKAEALAEHFKQLCIEAGGYITATDKDGEYAESFIRRMRPPSGAS